MVICIVVNLVICVNLGLLYISVPISPSPGYGRPM